jgi:acetyl esterase
MRAPGPEMQEVRELRIEHLNCRLYRPLAGSLPAVVYLHGGGWTVGSLDSHDRACRRLAAGTGASVLAVDYRLAPEHPWPASVDDTVAVLHWVATAPAELDHEGAVAVAGDSAGGTLAALACLRLRDEHPRALPDLQVLIYPNTNLTGDHPSMHAKASGFGLDADTVRFFNSQWVPDKAHWSDPRVSPLHAPHLRSLPPALIITAEHDVLRDEGEAYARRLKQADVGVQLRREPGLVHNFMLLDEISPACAAAADRVAADVRTRLKPRHHTS